MRLRPVLVLQPTDSMAAKNEFEMRKNSIDIRILSIEKWIDNTVMKENIVAPYTDKTQITTRTGIGIYSKALGIQKFL